MLQLNVKNETSRLRAVVLGSALDNGPTPTAEEAYDPKSLEHILAGTYPTEEDMVHEMEAFNEVFKKLTFRITFNRLNMILCNFNSMVNN